MSTDDESNPAERFARLEAEADALRDELATLRAKYLHDRTALEAVVMQDVPSELDEVAAMTGSTVTLGDILREFDAQRGQAG